MSVGRLVSTASELLTWNGNVEVGLIHTYRVIPVCGFGIDASSAKAVLKYYIRIESSGGAKLTSCGNRKACMAFCDSLARRAISEFYAQWRLEVGRWANTGQYARIVLYVRAVDHYYWSVAILAQTITGGWALADTHVSGCTCVRAPRGRPSTIRLLQVPKTTTTTSTETKTTTENHYQYRKPFGYYKYPTSAPFSLIISAPAYLARSCCAQKHKMRAHRGMCSCSGAELRGRSLEIREYIGCIW